MSVDAEVLVVPTYTRALWGTLLLLLNPAHAGDHAVFFKIQAPAI